MKHPFPKRRASDLNGTDSAALSNEPANAVFYGENIVITGSAVAGMVDEVPALSGIFIEGRAIHVVANRYITVSPNAVILGKGTQPAADIVISGILEIGRAHV